MKIKSVELMRKIRDMITEETSGMPWPEHQKFIRDHSYSLQALLKNKPHKPKPA